MKIDSGVSVIVCCFNSQSRIAPTLEFLSRQKVNKNISWEIILVDNNSTDRTVITAEETWKKVSSTVPFKVISEPNSGLSNARATGIRQSRYEYLLFCDDDNWLHENYIQSAYELLESQPDIGVLGGRGEARSDGLLPCWFTTFQDGYAVGVQALKTGDVSERGFVWGAGMVFRKSVYNKLRFTGFRHLLTGRDGKKLLAGDDSEICKWFLLAGYKLYYDENLVFTHFITQERLSIEYYLKMKDGFTEASKILRKYDMVIARTRATGDHLKIRKFIKNIILLLSHFNNKDRRMQYLDNVLAYNPWPSLIKTNNETHEILKAFLSYRKTSNS